MIKHVVDLMIPGAKAEAFYDFMVDPDQELFRRWLPEEHRVFRVVRRSATSPLGDLIYYDEYLGGRKHRLAFQATIVKAERPGRVVYRMRKLGVDIPAYLDLALAQDGDALRLRHEVRIENDGAWRLATPIARMVCDAGFWEALEGHCGREWAALRDLLAAPGL